MSASHLGDTAAARQGIAAVMERVQVLPKPERSKPLPLVSAAQALIDSRDY